MSEHEPSHVAVPPEDTAIPRAQFESRVAAEFCSLLLREWVLPQDVDRRKVTHSTASIPGLAFESVRLAGGYPDTTLSVFFRDIARCTLLFGWRVRFWDRYHDSFRDRPEAYADWLWDDFFERIDIIDPNLPTNEESNPHGVTWLRASDLTPGDVDQSPWLGPE